MKKPNYSHISNKKKEVVKERFDKCETKEELNDLRKELRLKSVAELQGLARHLNGKKNS